MKKSDVIIIGAGAAGLMAARALAHAGKKVMVLEARERIGGRIYSVKDPLFSTIIECGAEFIHGSMRTTRKIMQEAGIRHTMIEGSMWRSHNGLLKKQEDFIEDWPLLMEKLKQLGDDMTIENFLNRYFSDEKYSSLKKSVRGFVEGYDAARLDLASSFALRDEWSGEMNDEQQRIEGGYQPLVNWLADEFRSANGSILLSSVAKEIIWKKGFVQVRTANQDCYTAQKLIITVPLGNLQADRQLPGTIQFVPELPEKIKAARSIGYGQVIKILLEFKTAFWEEKFGMENMGFLFSDAPVPTYWTQLPDKTPLLTGWVAGPEAEQLKGKLEPEILNETVYSLSLIFKWNVEMLKKEIVASRVINWSADPFTLGAYTYATINTPKSRKILSAPVDDTLFFAGEALYDGPEMGTVEAALANGSAVAEEINNGLS